MHRLFLRRHASQGRSRRVQPLLVTTCLGGSEAIEDASRSALSRVIDYVSGDGEVIHIVEIETKMKDEVSVSSHVEIRRLLWSVKWGPPSLAFLKSVTQREVVL